MNREASFKHVSLKFLSVLILRAIVYNDACVRVSLSLSLSLSLSPVSTFKPRFCFC